MSQQTSGPLDLAGSLRLTVQGSAGRLDLVVPGWTTTADLAAEYAATTGAPTPSALSTAAGRTLDASRPLEALRLEQGELLVVLGEELDVATGSEVVHVGSRRTAAPQLVLAAACALGSAAVTVVAAGSAVWWRPTAAGLLLLGALVAAAPRRSDASSAGATTGPVLGAAAGFVAAYSPHAGGLLLAVVVAGLAAAVVAALARSGVADARADLARVWLVLGGLVAAAAAVSLLVGASLLALEAIAFGAAVAVVRLLPALVVDVDDDVLLDLDRLAVTAWSAHDRPRGGRARHRVRPELVAAVVRRSQRTVVSGVLASCLVASVAGPLVVTGVGGQPTTWGHLGGLAMVALGAAFLALVGRSFRSTVPRVVLGTTAVWLTGVLLVAAATDLGTTGRWYAVVAAAVLAPLVLVAAVALGGGWRSVWWARLGEVLETLTGVLVLALVPLACGLFDVVRGAVG